MDQPHQLENVQSNLTTRGTTVTMQGAWQKASQGTRQILALICVEGLMSASVATRALAWLERIVDNQLPETGLMPAKGSWLESRALALRSSVWLLASMLVLFRPSSTG